MPAHIRKMIDIDKAYDVEITVDNTGKLWINVDGICLLRIGKANIIMIDDKRKLTSKNQ